MSFEGYEQVLCENGHLIHFDVMETFCNDSIQDRVCSICGEKYVWFNVVDTTNGSFEINPDTGKEERIDGMNVGGRGELKYGLDVGKDDPNGNIVLKSRKDVPVFLLNLPKEDLRQHLNKVDYDGQSMSGLENRIINSFLGSMVGQIRTFEDAEWAEENSGSFAKIRALYDRRMINI